MDQSHKKSFKTATNYNSNSYNSSNRMLLLVRTIYGEVQYDTLRIKWGSGIKLMMSSLWLMIEWISGNRRGAKDPKLWLFLFLFPSCTNRKTNFCFCLSLQRIGNEKLFEVSPKSFCSKYREAGTKLGGFTEVEMDGLRHGLEIFK